jgi:hypothetical protein
MSEEGGIVGFAVGGAHEGRWGVAFVLFVMAVVGIGASFVRIRHEWDWGTPESYQKKQKR